MAATPPGPHPLTPIPLPAPGRVEGLCALLAGGGPRIAKRLETLLAGCKEARFRLLSPPDLPSALEILERGAADLVFLEMGGAAAKDLESLERLSGAAPDTPIVALLARPVAAERAAQILLAGAQECLVRTRLNPEILERAARYAIERHATERSLRRTEENFRLLADHIPGVIYIRAAGPEGETHFINRHVETLTGIPAEAYLDGRARLADLIHPEDRRDAERQVELAIARGEPYHLTYRLRDRSGAWRWIEDFGVAIFRSRDSALFLEGFLWDVTERKQAERERRILGRLGLDLVEADNVTSMGVALSRATEELFLWDAFFLGQRVAGEDYFRLAYGVDKVGGRRIVVQPPKPEKIRYEHLPGLLQGEPALINRQSDKEPGFQPFGDRARKSASLIYVPILLGDKVYGVLSVQSYTQNFFSPADVERLKALADIVAPALRRFQAEESLRRSEERASALLAAIPDLIFLLGADGRYLDFNAPAHRRPRTPPEDFIGKTVFELLPEEVAGPALDHIQRALRSRKAEVFEYALELEGVLTHFEARLIPCGQDRALAIIRDISDRVRDREALARQARQLEEANERLAQLARTDDLTGLCNRRYFMDSLRHECALALRHKIPLCLMILDLDHFKEINDTYGHLVGDRALQAAAALLPTIARETDIVSRVGGEEFAILLPYTELDGAFVLAERLRAHMAATSIEAHGQTIHLTCSIGVADYQIHAGEEMVSLYRRADHAMFDAKAAGRNCVRVAPAFSGAT